MSAIVLWALVGLVVLVWLFAFALCLAAARADQAMEAIERLKQES